MAHDALEAARSTDTGPTRHQTYLLAQSFAVTIGAPQVTVARGVVAAVVGPVVASLTSPQARTLASVFQ